MWAWFVVLPFYKKTDKIYPLLNHVEILTMPIYEYQCHHCGKYCEFLQKVTDDPVRQCPHCKKDNLEKRISPAAFHLKGSGWYATDFKSKQKSPDATSDASDKKSDDKKTKETTSETTKKSDVETSTRSEKPEKEQ